MNKKYCTKKINLKKQDLYTGNTPSNLDVLVSIQEMSTALQRQHEGIDAIKKTATTYLQIASLVVALISGLQLSNSNRLLIAPYRYIFISIFLFYIFAVSITILVILPTRIEGPISPKWEILQEQFLDKKDRDVLVRQLSAIVNAIEKNMPILEKLAKQTKTAGISFGLILVSLFILVIIS